MALFPENGGTLRFLCEIRVTAQMRLVPNWLFAVIAVELEALLLIPTPIYYFWKKSIDSVEVDVQFTLLVVESRMIDG